MTSAAEVRDTIIADTTDKSLAERLWQHAGLPTSPFHVRSALRWLKDAYSAEGKTLYEAIPVNPGYQGIKAPRNLRHRYIFDDVPCSLVPSPSLVSATQMGWGRWRVSKNYLRRGFGYVLWFNISALTWRGAMTTIGIYGVTTRWCTLWQRPHYVHHWTRRIQFLGYPRNKAAW